MSLRFIGSALAVLLITLLQACGGGGGTSWGGGNGGSGAVRIIWGTGRSYPSNAN